MKPKYFESFFNKSKSSATPEGQGRYREKNRGAIVWPSNSKGTYIRDKHGPLRYKRAKRFVSE